MLVLTRKSGEKIQIGEEITLSIEQIRGDRVRIGVTAPRHIPVYREELLPQVADFRFDICLPLLSGKG